VAADINELAKIAGSNVSEFTAAKIATKIFVYCCPSQKLNPSEFRGDQQIL
jgi:agmatinase